MTLFPLYIAASRPLYSLQREYKSTSFVINVVLALSQLRAEDEHEVLELMLKGYFIFYPQTVELID